MKEMNNILIQAKLVGKTNWLQAEKLLLQGVEDYPQSGELLLELAKLYYRKQYYRKAIDICYRGLQVEKGDEFMRLKALSYFELREYHLALNCFSLIKKKIPENLYLEAMCLARLKRRDEAIVKALKVLDYDVKSTVPYILIAELYFNNKDFDSAIRYCNKAESIRGESVDVCVIKGFAWLEKKNYINAYWELHRAEKFKIKNAKYYRSYGLVCEGIGKTKKAIELMQKAIEIAPDAPGAYLELFQIYITHDMLIEASRLLEAARTALPEDFPLTVMYNRIIDDIKEERH